MLLCSAAIYYLIILPKSVDYVTSLFNPPPPKHHVSYVTPPPPPPKSLPDADVLATRFPKLNPAYQEVRDGALAAYAHDHLQPKSYDDEARAVVKLLAYLSVCGDFYGECIWQQVDAHVEHINKQCTDPIWCSMNDVYVFIDRYSSNDASASAATKRALDFAATKYPALMKQMVLRSAIHNLIRGEKDKIDRLTTSLADLPKVSDLAVQNYSEMISAHLPHDLLYAKADDLFRAAQDDETTIDSINDGITKSFTAKDPGNPIAAVVLGDFYTTDAWTARGSGWASTVTADGWRLFADRLSRAENILTDAYAKNPEEASTCRVMMTVVLGQEKPRDQMELWFQRGIKIDPNSYSIYMAKRYYLLPRWYGSEQEVRDFGTECAKSDNWAAKIPLILIEAIDDAGQDDPSVYARPEIWGPVEQVFRGYLDHYPDALTYRTRFFQCAVQGRHWDVANEQLKIMNGDWDRKLFERVDITPLIQQAKEHAN